ncbi:MAG: hypothetical protein QRY72_00830 [Candidatus Rhabdochlamydia sp.]
MIDLTSTKKNKITLSDYNYKEDIANRLLLADLNADEFAVLEELLFSPIKTSLTKLSKTTSLPREIVMQILEKFAQTTLVTVEDDTVTVDKEMRKYFEWEFERFADDFAPGMEFLQLLLKKVPIHILPLWYAIPRMTNNIFESVIEKYLITPSIYQRYLLDIQFPTPILSAITQDLLKASSFELLLSDIAYKYTLTDEELQEMILQLEFHFIATVVYRTEEKGRQGVLTLFQEWKDYLTFLRKTAPTPLHSLDTIDKMRPLEFSFVEDLTALCQLIKKEALFSLSSLDLNRFNPPLPSHSYLDTLLTRGKELNLIEENSLQLELTEIGLEWLDLRVENKALYLYRHPRIQNFSQRYSFPVLEKMVREIEKSSTRITHSGWVYLDEFLQSVQVALQEDQSVTLSKIGRGWKYALPTYSIQELSLITAVLTEHLFESGLMFIGSVKGRSCLCLTPFGHSFFGS